MVLVESVVRENRAGKIPIMLANLDNKTVKVQKGERLRCISPAKISKQINSTETHPHGSRRGKNSQNDLNVPREHRRKIRNLIHCNRDVVNSDKESERTRSFQMQVDTENHSPEGLKPYRNLTHKRKLVEESLGPFKSCS